MNDLKLLNRYPKYQNLILNSLNSQRINGTYLISGDHSLAFGFELAASIIYQSLEIESEAYHQLIDGKLIDFYYLSDFSKTSLDKLQAFLSYPPYNYKYKVYLIEKVEKLSLIAINSLLKTLEEQNAHTVAILTCDNLNKVLDTVKSRSQIIDLSNQIPKSELYEKYLKMSRWEFLLYSKQNKISQLELNDFILNLIDASKDGLKYYQYLKYNTNNVNTQMIIDNLLLMEGDYV